jgi:hypothetical protein
MEERELAYYYWGRRNQGLMVLMVGETNNHLLTWKEEMEKTIYVEIITLEWGGVGWGGVL